MSLYFTNTTHLRIFPEDGDILSKPDHRGWLPIHWAAYNNRSAELMQYLINHYYEGIYEVTKKGKLPFQLATGYNRYTMLMDILLQENPDSVQALGKQHLSSLFFDVHFV